VTTKKRRTLLIATDILGGSDHQTAHGLSESEQIRQGIQWWLAARNGRPNGNHRRRTPENHAGPRAKTA
jgi:hypothetical protein